MSELYQIAPLGIKLPNDLEIVFSNSKFKYFVYHQNMLVGVGRALADGKDCSYICDIAIHPDKEGFYVKLGFKKMNTAMAIFQNEIEMLENGTISEP